MKWLLVGVAALVILVGGFFVLNAYIYHEKQAVVGADPKNAEYVIDGQRVQLSDGVAETESAPGAATRTVTRYFGNELETDLDGDGDDDVVFLLTQQPGGSGTFYYVVAALATDEGYVGSEAYLLGDRIAPQTTELSRNPQHDRVIVVNYADRAPGEPMSAEPSVGKTVLLKLDPTALQFGIVAQDFEGEADPSRMSLTMKSWRWVSALYNDGRRVEPLEPGRFVLSFEESGRFSATTDCNSASGNYVADEHSISFAQIATTKMFCPDSQEGEFLRLLEEAVGYHFTSRGELVLDLKFDSGTATFR